MILNLTQHPANPDQIAAGVRDLTGETLADLRTLLTFDFLPEPEEILARANNIAMLAALNASPEDRGDSGFALSAMIGGALWLMAPLADALREQGIEPVFAFSTRESAEAIQPDGSVRKTQVFRHVGFVPAPE